MDPILLVEIIRMSIQNIFLRMTMKQMVLDTYMDLRLMEMNGLYFISEGMMERAGNFMMPRVPWRR